MIHTRIQNIRRVPIQVAVWYPNPGSKQDPQLQPEPNLFLRLEVELEPNLMFVLEAEGKRPELSKKQM